MQADALLTKDELDFILDMQQVSPLDQAPTSGLQVNGDRRLKDLLTRLVANEQVTLQAHFNNQQISFPLQLVEDESHSLHLQLGAPDIYEDGPRLRPWRLALATPLPLLDAQGKRSGLFVRDISLKGALLEVRDLPQAPARFDLRFAPGTGLPIDLSGVLRRRIHARLAAYDLSSSSEEAIERLRDYIFQAHRQAHPDLHTQVSL